MGRLVQDGRIGIAGYPFILNSVEGWTDSRPIPPYNSAAHPARPNSPPTIPAPTMTAGAGSR